MIREDGVVVQILNSQRVRVSVDAAGGAQCVACGICRLSGDEALLDVPAPRPLEVGERVTVEIPRPGVASSIALLFILPMLAFVFGTFAGEVLRAQRTIEAGPWASVVMGIIPMSLAYGGILLYEWHVRRAPEHRPRIK